MAINCGCGANANVLSLMASHNSLFFKAGEISTKDQNTGEKHL